MLKTKLFYMLVLGLRVNCGATTATTVRGSGKENGILNFGADLFNGLLLFGSFKVAVDPVCSLHHLHFDIRGLPAHVSRLVHFVQRGGATYTKQTSH